MSIHGHPIHPMVIHFPVAALIGLIGADLGFMLTDDYFWARLGIWLAGIGAVGGWISGSIGMLDLIIVPQIRSLITAWCHGMLAVMMLSLATLNWLLRLNAPDLAIEPWGLYLSLLTGLMISLTSLLGGELVYDHAVGVSPKKMAKRRENL
ncbi:DUF2231 domain-containing protein [Halopseudomonas sp.]|uniref:DUF2231 domain-containing protein n=1 Tax=Halopseudomonas sp. TaxID=2901191 RepID=UPI003569CBE8